MPIHKLIAVAGLLCGLPLVSRAQSPDNKVVAAKNYTEDQIQAFNRKAEREYHQLDKKFTDLKTKAQKETGDAKTNYDKKVAEAQQKADKVKAKLEQMKTATKDAWANVKADYDKGVQELKHALK